MNILRRMVALGLAGIGVTVLAFPSGASANPPPTSCGSPARTSIWATLRTSTARPSGSPSSPGTRPGARVTPKLDGYLHLDSARGMHAQIRMEYYDVFDTKLATRYGGTVVPTGTGRSTMPTGPVVWPRGRSDNPAIHRVNIALTYDGTPPTILTTVRQDYTI